MANKKLTTEEVKSKSFKPVRLGNGYSMAEVDDFMDLVEVTLSFYESEVARLQKANEKLKDNASLPAALPVKSSDLPPTLKPSTAPPVHLPPPAPSSVHEHVETSEVSSSDKSQQVQELESQIEELNARILELEDKIAAKIAGAPATLSEASSAATRMLEMAGRNHDELVEQGKATADELVTSATKEAKIIKDEAEAYAAEVDDQRDRVLGSLATEKAKLEKELEELKTIERTSREELFDHFTQKLSELRKDAPAPKRSSGLPKARPTRTRSAPATGPIDELPSLEASKSSHKSEDPNRLELPGDRKANLTVNRAPFADDEELETIDD